MIWQEAMVARMTSAAAIAAIIGSRAAFFELPRGNVLPSLELSEVFPGRDWTHGGPDALINPRLQFDCWGATKTAAKNLAVAVQAEMERIDPVSVGGWTFGPPAILETSRQSKEDLTGTEGVFRWMLDFSFWARPQ